MTVGYFGRVNTTWPTIRAESLELHAALELAILPTRDGGAPAAALGQIDLASSPYFPFGLAADVPVRLMAENRSGPVGPLGQATFIAAQGTLSFDQLTQPVSNEMMGRLRGVRFFEYASVPRQRDGGLASGSYYAAIDGGACLSLADTDFDTRGMNGVPCINATECGDPTIRHCEPNLGVCATGRCVSGADAGPTLTCFSQTSGAAALYTTCDPISGIPCRADQTCGKSTNLSFGGCVFAGTLQRDAECSSPTDTTDPCAKGLQCANVSPSMRMCTKACDAWSNTAPCRSFERCVGQICTQPSTFADPAPVGARCALSSGSKLCADDGSKYVGVCHVLLDAGLYPGPASGLMVERECRRACAVDSHCGDGGVCKFRGCYP